MPRFARATFAVSAAISLALCLAALALWPLSHYRSCAITYGKSDASGGWALGIATDALIIERIDFDLWPPGFKYTSGAAGTADLRWQRLGFGFHALIIARLPLWFIVSVTALPPLVWGWKRRRRHRTAVRGFPVQQPGRVRTADRSSPVAQGNGPQCEPYSFLEVTRVR